MVDNLRRLREPAAWVVLAVTAASIVLALVRFGVAVSLGEPFTPAAQTVALDAMNLTLVVVVVGLAWACVFVAPPTPRARRVVLLSAVIVTLGTLLTLAGAVAAVVSAVGGALGVVLELVGGLLDIILKGVGAVTLWLVHRGLRGGRIGVAAVEPAPAVAAVEVAPEPPRAPTTWTPDAAAGSVWTSASDAAAGAPASGFGRQGDQAGWHPVARPDDPHDTDSPPNRL
ncbi:hypothetical protein [Propioniciclava soli]|uniref:hypothetical protein n=1 Tax=Propioniciclava soli TaxID=2775081 RepID=UPI001E4DEFCB|nr:hypothetical protein [Propioniciclava soli]